MIHMMIGNVGTGKSTTAQKIFYENKETISINIDDLCYMYNMGHYEDEYWTDRYRNLYLTSIWVLLENALDDDWDIILDGTNMNIERRKDIFQYAKSYNVPIIGYLHSDHESGLKRRQEDNRGRPDDLWQRVHDNFQSQYTEPTLEEGFAEIKRIN